MWQLRDIVEHGCDGAGGPLLTAGDMGTPFRPPGNTETTRDERRADIIFNVSRYSTENKDQRGMESISFSAPLANYNFRGLDSEILNE